MIITYISNYSMRKALFYITFVLSILSLTKAYSQEIYTQANAANPTNEGNSVEGWGGSTTNTVVSDEVFSGNYSIKLEAQTDGWRNAEYIFTTIPGERYKITIYAKSGTPVRQGFYLWEGFNDFVGVDNIVQEWTEYTWNLTASGTSALIRVYTGHPSVVGNTIYIDNISIVKEDLQAPTPPSLSSVSQTIASVNLSWSGATDNIGVTGYKIYKDGALEATLGNDNSYQVTGLTAGTSYQFTIKAIDAYGNESSASNAVSVTMDSSGGGSSGGTVWTEANSVASYTGNVAVGTSTVPNGYQMAVDGKLIAEEVKVQLSGSWPDYVFKKGYDLPTLEVIKEHIDEKGHLPNVPSAKEIEANGIQLGEMNIMLLEKIEELTLYILGQEKKILLQQKQITALKDLEARIAMLEKK